MTISLISRLLAVCACALAVSGCYFSKEQLFPDGEALPWGELAACSGEFSGDRTWTVDLKSPVKGKEGVTFKIASDKAEDGSSGISFKRISDDLYLAETDGRVHRYAYLLRQGASARVLAYQMYGSEAVVAEARRNDVLVGPETDGWHELIARKADARKFLMNPKIGHLRAVGTCTFRQSQQEKSIFGLLDAKMTRAEVLKVPGAKDCNMADVCFSAEALGLRYKGDTPDGAGMTVAFTEFAIKDATLSIPAAARAIPGGRMKALGEMVKGGPVPILIRLNDQVIDLTRIEEIKRSPKEMATTRKILEAAQKSLPVVQSDDRLFQRVTSEAGSETVLSRARNHIDGRERLKAAGFAVTDIILSKLAAGKEPDLKIVITP